MRPAPLTRETLTEATKGTSVGAWSNVHQCGPGSPGEGDVVREMRGARRKSDSPMVNLTHAA